MHARDALSSVTAVQRAVGEIAGLVRGRLVVGMVIGCTVVPLFDALATFHRAHPGIEISLLEDNSEKLADGVRAGSIDFALIGTASETPAGLNALTIVSERLVALVPHDSPLAKRKRLTLAEVTEQPVVCMPEGTGIRTIFDRSCAAQGIRPAIALEASAAAAIADLATRGLGIAILSESMASRFSEGLVARPIVDATIPALLALVWGTSTNPALTELVRHGREAFGVGRSR